MIVLYEACHIIKAAHALILAVKFFKATIVNATKLVDLLHTHVTQ